jgi:hypothetical protein
MNKDKHVLPDDTDTFTDRVRREAAKQWRKDTTKTIYGPDNEPLAKVNVKKGR